MSTVKRMPSSPNNRSNASQRWILTPILILILLVGFALRTAQLSRQPLWWDEGLNARYANCDLPCFVHEVRINNDTNPPAHRLALMGWNTLVGSSPFALRYLSVWFNILSIALTWAIGRWLTNRRVALFATGFMALSPMQVYYAREAKGYTFAAMFCLLAIYLWGKRMKYEQLHRDSFNVPTTWNGDSLAYILSIALSVGAHYYQILPIIWQGIWTLSRSFWGIIQYSRYRRAFKLTARWIVLTGAGGLLILPWVLLTFDTTFQGVTNISEPEIASSLPKYIHHIIQALSASSNIRPTPLSSALPFAMGGLAILGGIAAHIKRAGPTSEGLFLLTWLSGPILFAYALQAKLPFFSPRFLLYLGTSYYILVAQGTATLGEAAKRICAKATQKYIPCLEERSGRGSNLSSVFGKVVIALLVLAVASIWSYRLVHIYTASIDQNEDFRPVACHLRSLAKPNDALIYNYIWQVGYIMSYDSDNDLTFYRSHYDPQEVQPSLSAIFEKHPRLWLLNYRIAARDENNLHGMWLEKNAYKLKGIWYGYHQLILYLAPDAHIPGIGPVENIVTFEKKISLTYPAVDIKTQPGDVFPLPLHWQALDTLEEDYQVLVHLGHPNAPPLAQNDGPPHNGLTPTTAWAIGKEVIDLRALRIPQTLAPGRYALMVGLYDKATGERLSPDTTSLTENGSGKRLRIGYVTVHPPSKPPATDYLD